MLHALEIVGYVLLGLGAIAVVTIAVLCCWLAWEQSQGRNPFQ